MNRRSSAVALVMVMVLTGCRAEPASSGAKGTVVARSTDQCAKCWRVSYYLTVKEDRSGKRDKGKVSKKAYDACQKGERWPDCKR